MYNVITWNPKLQIASNRSRMNQQGVTTCPKCFINVVDKSAFKLTSLGLNSSGDRRRYMVMRACVAVGTLLSFRLNVRSFSEPKLCCGLLESRDPCWE